MATMQVSIDNGGQDSRFQPANVAYWELAPGLAKAILRSPAWGRRPLLAQQTHPQRLDLGRGHSGHEEAPALESPYYGAECFMKPGRRSIFASRVEQQGRGDGE
ncbi:uncharacterized protein TrAtP1_008157 [Trichoderma atroviride]|uniref:Uncharacterized protein n=1 Tax=Hypocrea atroviridis (strain ATCC 20476 / IMI 206040) TaxID=452589 RepID=G9NYY1_HYPAI|nr:uncharacterized protein TRIATDRAFT_309145 [Trichoderma atroviride IMI 206040]EHK43751.1 hypothetical protein TRIATDRAFT_309145 [Trichoderma atroviride IMI 206040]UKZ66993.1 hypothetical protein TrAtP1_008157 [Trichoderma atroviride]